MHFSKVACIFFIFRSHRIHSMESKGSEQDDVKIFDVSPFLLEKSQESKQPKPTQPTQGTPIC